MGSCVLPSYSEVCWVIFYVADLGVLRTHGEVLEQCYGPFTDWFIKVLRFIFITLVMYMVSIYMHMNATAHRGQSRQMPLGYRQL